MGRRGVGRLWRLAKRSVAASFVLVGSFDLGFPRMAHWRSRMNAREPSLAQDDIAHDAKFTSM